MQGLGWLPGHPRPHSPGAGLGYLQAEEQDGGGGVLQWDPVLPQGWMTGRKEVGPMMLQTRSPAVPKWCDHQKGGEASGRQDFPVLPCNSYDTDRIQC